MTVATQAAGESNLLEINQFGSEPISQIKANTGFAAETKISRASGVTSSISDSAIILEFGDATDFLSPKPATLIADNSEKRQSADRSENFNTSNGGSTARHQPKNQSLNETEIKEMFQKVIKRVKQDYELTGVLRGHGINLKRGAGGYMIANCPFPNHADSSPSFKVKSGSEQYCCYGCSAKGDVLDFIRDYHRLNGVTEAIQYLTGKNVPELYKAIKGGAKLPDPDQSNFKISIQPAARAEPDKSPEEIKSELENATNVYVALLGLLEIEPVHAEQLQGRGINLSEALLLGYRSFPTDRNKRIKICKQLRQAGCELKGVPGFFRLPPREFSKGQWCMGGDRWGFRDIKTDESKVYQVTGLLIPTRDLEGKIRRLKIRNDAPGDEIPEPVKARFPERYMAFSSTAREDGSGSGAWVHVAHPIYPNQNSKQVDTLWITEGEIKADIAALFLGETVLGMPGVGQSPGLAIKTAQEGGFREICVAMDAEEKPHVKLAIASLIKLAMENSLSISVACWDEKKGKGLDDLLAAGGAPEVFEPDNWWNRLSNDHKKYVTDRINGRGAVR